MVKSNEINDGIESLKRTNNKNQYLHYTEKNFSQLHNFNYQKYYELIRDQ